MVLGHYHRGFEVRDQGNGGPGARGYCRLNLSHKMEDPEMLGRCWYSIGQVAKVNRDLELSLGYGVNGRVILT